MTREEQAPPFNLLLDRLPDSYEGFLIRTDYRIGIQISLCLQDGDLTQEERAAVALSLLYGEGVPPLDTALSGLAWFLSCGQPKRDDILPLSSPQRFWFDFDHARIAASFRKSFGIELHRANLHWFEFMSLLDCVDEDSSLASAIQLRGTDTSQMKGRQRAQLERAKRLITPPRRYSAEEQEAIDEFFSGL